MGLHLRTRKTGESLLPETAGKGGAFEGSMRYPVDKKGRIINAEAGYHSFELLSGEDATGELAVAVLGVHGALKHLLTDTFDRPPRSLGYGYQDFEIRDGQIVGVNGATERELGSWPPEALAS